MVMLNIIHTIVGNNGLQNYENGKKVSYFTAYGHAFFAFIQMLLFKKGIFDGRLGITLSVYHFMYTLTKYIKLIALQRGKAK